MFHYLSFILLPSVKLYSFYLFHLSIFLVSLLDKHGGAFMVEIVGLGFWVFGHGNRFVDWWVWVMVVVEMNEGCG